MLGAYLYRVRRSLLKNPLKFILLFLALAMSVFMIFFPTLMAGGEDEVVRNPNIVLGGISLVMTALFDFMFYSGVKNGVVGYSLSDVNFHLAGPFSPKFNLIILVEGVITTCAMLIWVLSCQVAVLYSVFGVNSIDVVALLIGSAFAMFIGFCLACFFGAKFAAEEEKKKLIYIPLIAANVIVLGGFVVSLFTKYGSFGAIKALGGKGIVAEFGSSIFSQIFPVSGWLALIYSGIVKNSLVYVIVGIVLIVLAIVAIYFLYSRNDVDYYEKAIENAQKVADIIEARKAGIDTDTANLNKKIKVGAESLTSGWGAGSFRSMHLLQNKRASKLFFVNSLAMLYRIMCAIYMFFMRNAYTEQDDKIVYFTMGLVMMTLLNVVVFGGGKTVLEFNKPFIYMIPESAPSKLFNCLLADMPEIIFDSVLCAAIMWFFTKCSITVAIGVFVFMIVFDYLCELVSIIEMRLFRGLGRFLLMFVRYIMIFVMFFISIIPAIVVYTMTSSMNLFIIIGALGGAIMVFILLLISRNIIDYVEYEK